MALQEIKPVLVLGGTGVVGQAAITTLRTLHPTLPIAIGARDLPKAERMAESIGNATALAPDLRRADLGLNSRDDYSLVVTFFRDNAMAALDYASAKGIPYISFSDFLTEMGPAVARYIQRPRNTSMLMLSHYLGGLTTLAALHLARAFDKVDTISISALLDEDDVGGPASVADNENAALSSPNPLVLANGTWRWPTGADATYSFRTTDGVAMEGHKISLPDVLSLAAGTGARSAWIGYAVGAPASRRRGEGMTHEIIIEAEGILAGGTNGRARLELVDPAGYPAMSGRGAGFAIERMLGLAGGNPVGPGLHYPETIHDLDFIVGRMKEFGTRFNRVM